MRVLLEIAIVLALMMVNGALAMSELAMMASRRGRLEQRAAEGDAGARAALRLLDDPTALLSAVQVGITLVGILAGAFSGATLGASLATLLVAAGVPVATAHTLGIGGVVLTLTYLSLVVGELVPKRLALADPEGVASRIAGPMGRLARLGAPVVWLLRTSTNAVLRLLGIAASPTARVTEDEIRSLLAEGAAAGVVKPVEHEMIEGVMRIADWPVRTIMTPRTEVAWLDADASLETLRATFVEGAHARYPVCRGSLDELVGVVHLRQLVGSLLASSPIELAALAEPALMVHEGRAAVRLVELFRETGAGMAIVLDEYGTVEGLVTPGDLLTAIAGELSDEGDEAAAEAVRRPDGSWLVDGRMEIHRLERLLGQRDLAPGGRYQTAAGLVLWELGRMPRTGDRFRRGGLEFEVVDLDGRRIDKLLITPASDAAAS
ncbi:MAG: hemolysin family protein [Geminicoccaceae bacterium]